MQESRNNSIQSSLDRLLLCSQMREFANVGTSRKPVTVKDITNMSSLVLKLAYRLRMNKSFGLKISTRKDILASLSLIILLRLKFYPKKSLKNTLGIFTAALGKLADIRSRNSEITGYITSSDQERSIIRICLLLWAMGRFGDCVELLIRRFNSGMVDTQTRRWLALFLREIGDTEAANNIAPPPARPEAKDYNKQVHTPVGLPSTNLRPSRLKYGVVMSVMFDSDVFRSSLLSLLNSDFRGSIIVAEDGHQPKMFCESFCTQLPVTYVKHTDWKGGQAATVNLGIEQLAPETDIVINVHGDILFPTNWFDQLRYAWDRVYDSGKVGIINLGYIEPRPKLPSDIAVREAFVRGQYDDLLWVLAYPGSGLTHDVHSHNDMRRLFGLARCRFNDSVGRLHLMTGRFSPAASFLLQTWRDIGGFDPELPYAMDSELHYYGYQNRKWNLWVNNAPLIHLQGGDTSAITGDDITQFMHVLKAGREAFEKKYGWDLGHFIFTYFAETAIIYHDEIVDAANELRFSDIDYIFDDFWDRLRRKRLDSCELYWCQSRANCKYV